MLIGEKMELFFPPPKQASVCDRLGTSYDVATASGTVF